MKIPKSADMVSEILKDLEDLQEIPSPTFQEQERAAYMAQCFQSMGLEKVHIDETGNVIGLISGNDSSRKPLLISAHLDTVHAKSLSHKIIKKEQIWIGPGIGDNTLALAVLLNLAKYFKNVSPTGPIIFAANTAEEGLGDLQGIKALVNHYQDVPLFYLILEGIGLGVIFNRGLGVYRYRIKFSTPGGHSWGNFGQPSAIHEIAKFISTFNLRGINPSIRSSYNFGKIQGGGSINSIARQAEVDMEIRSESASSLSLLEKRLLKLLKKFESEKLSISIEKIGERPYGEISPQHWLVEHAVNQIQRLGIQPKLVIGSTDANYPLSKGYPAVCLCITKGGNVHTPDEFIQLSPIQIGFQQIVNVISEAWN